MKILKKRLKEKYKYGFFTQLEVDEIEKGLNEDIIKEISKKKDEPYFMLDFRLKAFNHWKSMQEPKWADLDYKIDYQNIKYYSSPKNIKNNEQDIELFKTFEKLGIPIHERDRLSGVAIDAVFDSVSIHTTHEEELKKLGIIFCSFSKAVKNYPDLVKKYLGSVVSISDNYFAALNAAVFTDGSFCYIPKGVKSPLDLSTYFRINSADTGQFERTLIVADEDSYVSYLEGCTAPQRDENQLHAAVVEIVALKGAEVKYSTVQNWFSGDSNGKGGIYNFVTKRGECLGENSKISWTQIETGSAITWKYPSVILKGNNSIGEFYSISLTNNFMKADTGTKMIHIGKNTKSTIISKGISADRSINTYRGLVKVLKGAVNVKNFSQCDSLLIGKNSKANTFPYIECNEETTSIEHEATTSKISEDQLLYLETRGIDKEKAISVFIKGYCKDVFKRLPLEFAVEGIKLIEMKLEGTVG